MLGFLYTKDIQANIEFSSRQIKDFQASEDASMHELSFRLGAEGQHNFQRGFAQTDASMRALWSDRQNWFVTCPKNLDISGSSLNLA